MIFTILITLAILSFSVLAMMILIYFPSMSKATRQLWAGNIALMGLRQLAALLQPICTKLFPYENIASDFKALNYLISIFICSWFIIYIQKRYSKEYNEKYKDLDKGDL